MHIGHELATTYTMEDGDWVRTLDSGYNGGEKEPGYIGYERSKITGTMYTVGQKSSGSDGDGQEAL